MGHGFYEGEPFAVSIQYAVDFLERLTLPPAEKETAMVEEAPVVEEAPAVEEAVVEDAPTTEDAPAEETKAE